MATLTTNYKLKKPATTDNVSIGDINSNMDIIDTQMKSNATAIARKQDTVSAGTGLAIASDGKTINHSNSITAKTTYVGSATAVPRIKCDAQGHITAITTERIYPPTTTGTSGQVWVSDGSGAGTWKTLVTISTSKPSGGSNGDLWFVYE